MNRLFLGLLALLCPLVAVQGQTTIFYEDFESGTLNPAFWTANPAATNGYVGAFNTTNSCGGSYVLWLGKTSDAGGVVINSADLRVDLSGYVDSQLTITFCTWDFYDESSADDTILVSNDNGASFHPLIDLNPSGWDDNVWGQRVPYDLDKLLSSQFGVVPDSIIIRFQQKGSGDFSTSGDEDGIGIDNVRISTERKATYASVPYLEDFESGSFGTEWQASSSWANAEFNLNALNRFKYVALQNATSWANGNYSLVMGKYRDNEGANLNAIDLHIDMGTYVDSQLLFNYVSADFFDESSTYDAIYASSHKDSAFKKIIEFEPSIWIQGDYGNWSQSYTYKAGVLDQRVPYDLDQLLTNKLGAVPDSLILRFVQYGSGDLNTNSIEDGIFLDNIRIYVDKEPAYSSAPYFEDFEATVLGPEWKIGSRAANDSLGLNALNRFESLGLQGSAGWGIGTKSLRMIKSNDSEGNNLNAIDLHLLMGTLVDSQLTLSFFTADFFDESGPYDGIYASKGPGHPFKPIISFNSDVWDQPNSYSSWDPYYWNLAGYMGSRAPYDLDKLLLANLGEIPDTLILRFQQYGSGDWGQSGGRDGIFLDNISIQVDPSPTYKNIPYFDGFESGVLGPEWKNASEKALGQTALSSNINLLTRFPTLQTVNSTGSKNGTYQLRMGKSADIEGTNFNALDLHLNLLGEGNVQLTYWIYEFFDEQQADEGLFLSVDAGKTFTQIYNFDLVTVPNNVWTLQTVDISALAAVNNLTLSDSTILRFQQLGSGDFNTFGTEDGLIFDDITINCTPQTADFNFTVDCSTLQVDFTDLSQGTNATTPFYWDIDGDGTIDTTGNGNLSYIFPGTGTYDVTLYVGNAQGCGDSITRQVFIGSSVPAPSVIPNGPTIDLCEGDTLLVTAQIGYQGYLWSNGASTPSVSITTPGTYSVRGLGIDGCYSTPTILQVIGRPAPLKPFVALVGEPVFCEGESVDLVAPFGASAYLWSTGATTSSITVTTSGTYSVQLANSFGCFSEPADTTITVLAVPANPVISGAGGSTWLTSSSTGETYTWFKDGVAISADSVSIDGSVFGAGTYTVKVANGDCESSLSDPYVFTLQSLEADWFGSLEIYPNPSQGIFTIEAELHQARSLRIQVFNSLGQEVGPVEELASSSHWKQQIDLSTQPNGIYHLRISDGRGSVSRQLVVER